MYVSVTESPAGDGYDPEDVVESGRPGGDSPGDGASGLSAAFRERMHAFQVLLARPLTPYYLIVGITTLLLCLGLVMVLSTGSVFDLSQGESPYADFGKQLLGVIIGLPMLWIAARSSPRLFRAAAYPLVAISILGLLLTLIHGVGQSTNGASRWIGFGSFEFQPSELAKLALAVWGADLLARKEKLNMLADWRHMLIPLLPGTAVLALLVMAGDDLGTTSILLVIFLTLLWVAGTPSRVFTALLILMALVTVLLIVTEGYRDARLIDFLNPTNTSPTGPNMQTIQGKIALGNGGVFGVGLGAGSGKWGWVPEDTSDFIFAIIGEELGLVGTLCVIALYGGLAYAGLRVARASVDTFSRLTAAAITAWIVIQAVINIGSVIGVVPPEGVPLPLVSAGLSSLLVTMVALGMLMSFARRTPGAAEALAARGPGGVSRVLSLVGHGSRQEEHG
ncbi:MAG TPA: putative lipid II flippase FtsW [Trebonia sp.]|jgi:cell division protein FtsW|nr:putative lipid II flippase FtsW [Trebonia sp.]